MTNGEPESKQTDSEPLLAPRPRDPLANPAVPSSARALTVMGPVVRLGFLAVGVASGLQLLSRALERPGSSDPGLLSAASAAMASVVFYGLVGWLSGRLLPAAGELLEKQQERAAAATRSNSLLESELIPALSRLADALERRPEPAVRRDVAHIGMEIRAAIRAAQWSVAQDLIRALEEEAPGEAETSRLAKELDDAKQSTVQGLLAKLAAAREASDPERVLEHRDGLVGLAPADQLREIDRDLARWFMGLIHKRLRAGTVRPDVAILAGRIAQSLDSTPEGASLRAALPTLRRSAGLCAQCAQPYTGIADACPNCLGAASFPVYQAEPGGDASNEE